LRFLFNWSNHNISYLQKIAAYAHLYSFASVKSVVHWFQIMREAAFQMYDDDVSVFGSPVGRAYRPARFPTQNIVTPIVLLYGDRDSLVDIKMMLKELPDHTIVKRLAGYEHLDILWGKDVHKDVIPEVVRALKMYRDSYDSADELKDEYGMTESGCTVTQLTCTDGKQFPSEIHFLR